MCNIESLYVDSKFEAILFYLKAHGILSVDELGNFDFDELGFVPGITPEVVEEAQNLYDIYLKCGSKVVNQCVLNEANTKISHIIDENEDVLFSPSMILNSASVTLIDNSAYAKEENCHVQDVLIKDVYLGIPRSTAFVNWCQNNEKIFMSQIAGDDFEQAKLLKGLGFSSVEKLIKVYQDFYDGRKVSISKVFSTDVHVTNKNLCDVLIEDVFFDLAHGGQLIEYCHAQGMKTIADMQNFSFDHREIKGIGNTSMKKLQNTYHDVVIKFSSEKYMNNEKFSDIPQVNRGIPLKIEDLNNQGYFYLDDVCQRGLPIHLYVYFKDILQEYQTPIGDIFAKQVDSLKEPTYICFTQRAHGYTLQKIADRFNITREGVRQVVLKTVHRIAPCANIIASVLLFPNKTCFGCCDLEALFSNPIHAESCKFVLREISDVLYLDFADKFIKKCMTYDDYYIALHRFVVDVIGDGLNFYENLENIEAQLFEYGLYDLGFDDIMNFLVKIGYHFYGDYVVKGKQTYGVVCRDAIVKFFPNGIKLDSDAANEDMLKLRHIILRQYKGLDLPDNNRALTARITPLLILSGRGRYSTIESVIYDRNLFAEVYKYIENAPHDSLYYHEIFAQFQGRFLAETNITNSNFLHGMLKYLYPDDFTYERDLLIKNGAVRQNIDNRICEVIINARKPLSKTEIKAKISGLNDFVISFAVMREPKLIQWDYNVFNHIDNISIDAVELSAISEILAKETAIWGGYLSDELLFKVVKRTLPEFIMKNSITNSLNLYYVTAFYFDKEYRFRRPHIISRDFPVNELNLFNIAKVLLNCENKLNYTEYVQLAVRLCWASGTLYSVFSELEKDYVRISENDYIDRSTFTIAPDTLYDFCEKISNLTKTSGYFALSSIFDFISFPSCNYEWNGFLVEAIISELDTGFKIISPQIKDRRYQRGIILPSNYPAVSFEQLVVSIMQRDNISALGELEMLNYLQNKGLTSKTIPQELYDSTLIAFKSEMFKVLITRHN
jgi:hypothetical protein